MKGFAKRVAAVGAIATGCLARPVAELPGATKVNFTSTLPQGQVDKVDLLFMIDNSISMGDKQEILAEAVPRLLEGLVRPRCLAEGGAQADEARADPNGDKENNYGCPSGTEPEFKPISDIHIGVISSSLGGFGGGRCAERADENDGGRLLTRAPGGGEVAQAKASGFLAWFPANEENADAVRHPPPATPIRELSELSSSFEQLVRGVGQRGCGYEAQLESVYHFLIQPDPWKMVVIDGASKADYGSEIDQELLRQRAAFLRPDSLVGIVMLTDEEDSSVDPLSLNGQGWMFMAREFPFSRRYREQADGTTAPRATSVCRSDPASRDCTSCGFRDCADAALCKRVQEDPECKRDGGYHDPADDHSNVRFHRMKERFGVDPQYPLSRYVDALTKDRVPDRAHERGASVHGGVRHLKPYSPSANCTNPLFAKTLPQGPGDELCALPRGSRTKDRVFFAVVGGVPHQLLHFVPNDPEASKITDEDWTKILGRDPLKFDSSGIDPHMIPSMRPRPGLPPPGELGDNGTDLAHGREWDTGQKDLQFACTFPLREPRGCTEADPQGCDCKEGQAPPLCSKDRKQVMAKAYPTTRELETVRMLGPQGIAASLCPQTTRKEDVGSATYGYNPAVQSIENALKNAITSQCLPQPLTRDERGEVSCQVLAELGDTNRPCEAFGLVAASPAVVAAVRAERERQLGAGAEVSALCEVPQLVLDRDDARACRASSRIGWCYLEQAAATSRRCAQSIAFSDASAALPQPTFLLQCLKQ